MKRQTAALASACYALRRRPLAKYASARGSSSGSPEEEMPSIRGIGSRIKPRSSVNSTRSHDASASLK